MHPTVRRAALDGLPLAGTWLSLGHADVAEMASQAGFDWLLIDHEHGACDWRDLQHQVQAIAAGGSAAAVVRVPALDAVA
ncbi:MAG TPA: aldolase/citrate lyase family protein, partial [Rubrivivax sp.]